MSDERGRVQQIGCHISSLVADLAANPFAQVGFVLLCLLWFWLGLNVGVLTAGLSILAITLTQMVLNSQQERERDAHRRDVALHAKLDELLLASRRARNELAGIEELEEEEIAKLKNGGPVDVSPGRAAATVDEHAQGQAAERPRPPGGTARAGVASPPGRR
jgi:low affinity Fe/Cu permease